VSTAYVFRYHLVWQLILKPGYVTDTAYEAPVRLMPKELVPENWKETTLKPVALFLPEELAATEAPTEEPGGKAYLANGLVIMLAPIEESSPDQDAELTLAEELFPREIRFSWPSWHFENYRADVDDFSWLMSQRDLVWYQYCMRHRVEMEPQEAEFWVTDRLEGFLIIQEESRADFQFQSLEYPVDGLLLFKNEEGPLDLKFVRQVCQLIRVQGPVTDPQDQ
ncbi:hypothetical protein AB1K70_25825, partial [Bremerella sp. JC770]|uniref:hypothetical protein n=1 Tax=Bremerella sp. JC770 TaxID=3232137 RepID=UPI003458C52A